MAGFSTAQPDAPGPSHLAAVSSLQFVPLPTPPTPPDYVAIAKVNVARVAAQDAATALAAAQAAQTAQVEHNSQIAAQVAYEASDGLTAGAIGYSDPGGNCVDIAHEYGKNQPGNPISWVPTTNSPFIGAAALFYVNHVAVVVGIYSNGDIEVAQANCPGCAHRISPEEIRGYF